MARKLHLLFGVTPQTIMEYNYQSQVKQFAD